MNVLSGRRRGLAANCLRGVLAAAEPFYGWYIGRRNRSYDSGRLPVERVAAPVISVGNLTVGGTGKTPLVCWLTQQFAHRGIGVTLISRGYGRSGGGPNDEALELAARLPRVPHLQDPDRLRAARQALAANPRQILILDDAFQHRRIARDLDIVLLDALEPFGFGRLLPRGLLREPGSSLGRAHIVGLSRAAAIEPARREEIRREVAQLAPRSTWIELNHKPATLMNHPGRHTPLELLQGKAVLAFCGIGNPAGFAHTLAEAGLHVLGLRAFPDHHAYTDRDLAVLSDWIASEPRAQAVVCTHKDLVKIPRASLGELPLAALTVEIDVASGQSELQHHLDVLSARLPP